ncbi:MAG: 50S ribosomal protein L5 [Candidatus Portnoybacteria bacterium CG10_big_fil_rev_8_21_14_0_10_36_7]|uniref:Large ribosomal subunit protein uL5 n=1 Tax=Candidatus Portnoybacteria bacterium CG10_big_fil_rev_8_21_14_0_10_36_7 TaxID=1974812 RepID=A0A2M8KDF5_9BACT|nr:MAG: 50S ribosomal protein L5 [Candidatus Portnoybacteria bacterium CG10_big_fil_rev_8_21_14_0_10_36_7]
MKSKNLKELYFSEVRPNLKKDLGFKNEMAVPKMLKVTLDTGIGRFLKDEKAKDGIYNDLMIISGQKPKKCPAKRAIASFKTREGLIIGYKVTLRGQRMYDFLTRFINIVLPRTRDFRGLDLKGIDKGGNLNIGVKEQLAFPEISQESVHVIFGLGITVTTNSNNQKEAEALFRALGFPFKK